jgi:hypothetical protein
MLDDLVVDVPLAYTFAAELIVAAGIPEADVEDLANKIDDEFSGDVAIKPKDKLLKAVSKVQGETAAV